MADHSTANLWVFLSKILVLSALISVAIKTIGPLLPIPASGSVALLLVLSPTVMMAGALALRTK